MTISPSSYGYCAPSSACGCGNESSQDGQRSNGYNFIIHRHDTCPSMVVEVKGDGREWVDMVGWSVIATLFSISKIVADIGTDIGDTVVSLDNTLGVHAGDIVRVESPDGREKMQVVSVDRASDSIIVVRGYDGTQIISHLMDTVVYAIKASDIPVEIEMTYENEGVDADYAIVTLPHGSSGGVTQLPSEVTRLTKAVLKVNWRSFDTAQVGSYYLQIELSNDNQTKRFTLPRGAIGFPVKILVDANDS